MLQCAVPCHLPSRDGALFHPPVGCNAMALAYGAMPGGAVCHGRQHLMPSAVGPYVFPIVVWCRRRHGGRREKYLKLVIAGAAGVPDLCNASQGWSKQPHRTDY